MKSRIVTKKRSTIFDIPPVESISERSRNNDFRVIHSARRSRLRRGVKLRKLLPSGEASLIRGNDGLSYDLGRCRCIHRRFWLMFLRVEDEKGDDLKESTEGGSAAISSSRGATACTVLRESSIDIQILQREDDSAAANICIRTFMKHPKKGKRTCSL